MCGSDTREKPLVALAASPACEIAGDSVGARKGSLSAIKGVEGLKDACCDGPKIKGYPEEDPVVQICLKCGKWS